MRGRMGGVLLGYVLFMGGAMLLFVFTGRDPYVLQSRAFELGSIAYGVLMAILSGYVAAWLGDGRPLISSGLLALLLAALALISWSYLPAGTPTWWMVGMLVAVTPATLLGGWLRKKWGASQKGQKKGHSG